MDNKKAFVFDTNFINNIKSLDKVCESLKENFHIYVPQVSIDERAAQQCRDKKEKYDKILLDKKELKDIFNIRAIQTYDEYEKNLTKKLNAKYRQLFNDSIIPYNKDKKTFERLLERAFKKIAPFKEEKNASDKGLKDALIWLSVLDYFKDNGENEIVFVTDDGGFKDNADFLIKEFKDFTGKNIEIKPNSYYKELANKEIIKEEKPLPNFEALRSEINSTIEEICLEVDTDFFGNQCFYKTFFLSEKVDESFVKNIFLNLRETIEKHIFEKTIQAEIAFETDKKLSNGEVNIRMDSLEKALKLFENIKNNYYRFLPQFYTAVTSIFNRNYFEKTKISLDTTELPF